jgi:hypothetical protein
MRAISVPSPWVRPGSRKGFHSWGWIARRFRPLAAASRLAAGPICRRSLANDVDGWERGGALSKKVAGTRRPRQAISAIRPYTSCDQASQRRDRAGARVLTAALAATANCMAAGEEPGDAGRCARPGTHRARPGVQRDPVRGRHPDQHHLRHPQARTRTSAVTASVGIISSGGTL